MHKDFMILMVLSNRLDKNSSRHTKSKMQRKHQLKLAHVRWILSY